ncbi:MAG: hypothetical protein JNK06_20380 [Candidatus Accumulibacter phosphatis]|uniref:hypothetical protein n=1 Tax=Candidatus Accumulibacter phosphatis TaxID=327160 RepID=UPI001A3E3AF7|nr:hypothetical protein [Candidatus Accumulibacter phosphatis]
MIESTRKQPVISVLHRLAGALELSLGEFCQRVDDRYQTELKAVGSPRRLDDGRV